MGTLIHIIDAFGDQKPFYKKVSGLPKIFYMRSGDGAAHSLFVPIGTGMFSDGLNVNHKHKTSQNKPAMQVKSFCPAFYKKRAAGGKYKNKGT